MASTHIKASLSHIHVSTAGVKKNEIFEFLKVWVIVDNAEPIEISTNIWASSKEPPKLRLDEFVINSSGEIRTLIEQIRKEGIFTDTGKRVQFNTNLWGEVWRLTPEHLALLQEKETQHEQAPSEHQSEHRNTNV